MPDALHLLPPDQSQRRAALDCAQSVLVQAPAGSGKTSLLVQRFLALLGQVDEPGQIVAITFTRAAAAEMRARVLAEIERAAADSDSQEDPLSTAALARRALERSRQLGWNLLDQPAQLRISTIDAFCRELALQQPLVSGLGGMLEIAAQPELLYRRAARHTIEQLDHAPADLRQAIEALLLWRDNNWAEMESLLAQMLSQRDRWMRDFVLDRAPDFDLLRARLEAPFARAVAQALDALSAYFDPLPQARAEILSLARFACEQTGGALHRALAEQGSFPVLPCSSSENLEDARSFYAALAHFLLTESGFRRAIDKRLGFPADRKREKQRMAELLQALAAIPGLEAALSAFRTLPPARYTDDDWRIVRAAFVLLRHAVAQLRIVFAEEGAADFTEISQTALSVLQGEQGLPGDSTLAFVDGIHHLLIDEFQDTSRRQHELLAHLIAAWPDVIDRTCFLVGDPMQSIYFFRDSEAELFARVRDLGLELPDATPLPFAFAQLRSNFRTAHGLVRHLNGFFTQVFALSDGSGIDFAPAEPDRNEDLANAAFHPQPELHLTFVPEQAHAARQHTAALRAAAQQSQLDELVALVAQHQARIDKQRTALASTGRKYRVAILGRTKKVLTTIAGALREAAIPYRAVEIENLRDRSEIADALALTRALLNPRDRVAWLGLLRAPWCALSLADLHTLASGDNPQLIDRALPELLAERRTMLSPHGQAALGRLLAALATAASLRAAAPAMALGTWLEQTWTALGGALCVDAAARANLDLLWKTLDSLPGGAQDLLGPALDAALEKLNAQPDPSVDEDFGVQLMTIHKSKGLEFEVVLIPDLQAGSNNSRAPLLSWLERGLSQPDEDGELTEFLVAPLQTKGAERGRARAWVEHARSQREQQEMRRLLYVAATRAREELHFFARPAYRLTTNGERSLAAPRASLLKTAWPALEAEITERFEAWKAAENATENATITLDSIAAAASIDSIEPPAPTHLLRLPDEAFTEAAPEPTVAASAEAASTLYTRHEGGLESRRFGNAVHALLEELSHRRLELDWTQARSALDAALPRIEAEIRFAGFDRARAHALAAKALALVRQASHSPEAEWLLSPRDQAASEQRWTGFLDGAIHNLQVDRIFRAGPAPLAPDCGIWWIVDYKTVLLDKDSGSLEQLRPRFAQQLESYARLLRHLKGPEIEMRAALYYPHFQKLDWWPIAPRK